MNSKPKIFILLFPGFPANEEDTSCLPAQQLFVRELQKLSPGVRIFILAFQYPFSAASYNWENCQVIAFGGKGRGKLYRWILWQRIKAKLGVLAEENDILGVLSFWYGECALIGSGFAKKKKIRHYTWILGQDAKKENKYVKWSRLKPGELIAMSDFLADEFNKNHSVLPFYVIPNGIDASQFSRNETEKDIDICCAGSLIKLKQYDIFVSIIEKLSKINPSINAVICGEGNERNYLELLVKSFGIENNISFTGELAHEKVLKMMLRSKIFLHTSSYEGFSGACLEALAAGAYVISFRRPMKAVINHWYFVNSEEEMLQKVMEILFNPATCYCSSYPYSMKDSAKKIMELFEPSKLAWY
jgi:glycosyltransferase involved in cell wall biosynthesis